MSSTTRRRGVGLGLALPVLIALIVSLMPATAAADGGGVSVSSDGLDNSAKVAYPITCATVNLIDEVNVDNDPPTPFGISANGVLWAVNGTFNYSTYGYMACQGGPNSVPAAGHLSVAGNFSGVSLFKCPIHYVEEELHVAGGTVRMGAAVIDVTNMTWVLAGNQFAITGSGVDDQGQQVTLSGYATHTHSSSTCPDWSADYSSKQYVTDLVINATYI